MSPLRNLLFKAVTALSAFLLQSNEWLVTFLTTLFVGVNAAIRSFFASISLKLMTALDPVTMAAYEKMSQIGDPSAEPSDTMIMNIELKLLEAGYKVRNHAQNVGWTEEHSEALGAVGDALLPRAPVTRPGLLTSHFVVLTSRCR